MKILRTLITCLVAVSVVGCRRSGKVDDWTWDAPDLKVRTCMDRTKRLRADVKNGFIELKFGEAGRDPLDIRVEHTEIVPAPKDGKWTIWSGGFEGFGMEHSELGTKWWTVLGVSPMHVSVSSEWRHYSEEKCP